MGEHFEAALEGDATLLAAAEGGRSCGGKLPRSGPSSLENFRLGTAAATATTPGCAAIDVEEASHFLSISQDLAAFIQSEVRQLEHRLAQQLASMAAGSRSCHAQLRHETEQREAAVSELRQDVTALQMRSQQQDVQIKAALVMLERQHENLVSQAAVLEQHSVSVAELRQADAEASVSFQKLEDGRLQLQSELAALAGRGGSAAAEASGSTGEAADIQLEWFEEELPAPLAKRIEERVGRERLARQASEGALQSRLGVLEQRLGQCQRFYIGSPEVRSKSKLTSECDGAAVAGEEEPEVRHCRTAEDLAAAMRGAAAAAATSHGGTPVGGAVADAFRHAFSEPARMHCAAPSLTAVAPLPVAAPSVLGSSELENKFESMHDAVDQLWQKVCGTPMGAAPIGPTLKGFASSGLPSPSPCSFMSDQGSTRADSSVGAKSFFDEDLKLPVGSPTGVESVTLAAAAPWTEGFAKRPLPWESAAPGGLPHAARRLQEENAALREALMQLAEDPRLRQGAVSLK